MCIDFEAEKSGVEKEFTTMRCYKELDYLCAKSFYMPCTPNYDESKFGEPIEGEEESCPQHFR